MRYGGQLEISEFKKRSECYFPLALVDPPQDDVFLLVAQLIRYAQLVQVQWQVPIIIPQPQPLLALHYVHAVGVLLVPALLV